MKKLIRVALVLSVLLIMGMGSSALAATFMVMKVEGLDGASKLVQGWIDIAAFRQEITTPTPDNPVVGPFIVTKFIDQTSPTLAYYAAVGMAIPRVEINYGTVVNGMLKLQYVVILEGTKITYFGPDVSKQGRAETVAFDSITYGNSRVTYKYIRPNVAPIEYTVPWN